MWSKMGRVCEECGGRVIRRKVRFSLYGETVGLYPAEVCSRCGEEVFSEETAMDINAEAKRKGLWGLEAKARVTRVGTSVAVVINKRLVKFLGLRLGDDLYIRPESRHRIVMDRDS